MKTVACIMLANGRRDMVARAVASFHAQELEEKQLIIWNTGARGDFDHHEADDVVVAYSEEPGCIGELRNRANRLAIDLFHDEIGYFAHWDSDDWSQPRRLVEQIEYLGRGSARWDLVGYRECIFWDSTKRPAMCDHAGVVSIEECPYCSKGEAWIYRNANPAGAIGSSFLYPRATWERVPFPRKHAGEDTQWLLNGRGFRIFATPSTFAFHGLPIEPRMICSIHGGNTSSKISPGKPEWTRAAQYDVLCRERMRL